MGGALAAKLEALADAHGAHAQLFDLCEAAGDWQRLLDHMATSAAGAASRPWPASSMANPTLAAQQSHAALTAGRPPVGAVPHALTCMRGACCYKQTPPPLL